MMVARSSAAARAKSGHGATLARGMAVPVSKLGEVWRQDFQGLTRPGAGIEGQRLAFLDNAASAQKPEAVLEAIANTLEGPYANIHRGLYRNSAVTTAEYEAARETVADFFKAPRDGVVFTRNGTEAINLVAATWGRANLGKGDVVILSALEHHANIVPWQILRDQVGFEIAVADIADDGSLLAPAVEKLFKQHKGKVKLLAVTQMSNVLGVKPDLAKLIDLAHSHKARVLVDGCQGAVHAPQDFAKLGADFYVATGHKLYGPTGIGALLADPALLNGMPPYQGGGDMIETVTFEKTSYAKAPARFEAGTPAFVEAIGLAAALTYLKGLKWDNIVKHEQSLAQYLETCLETVPGLIRYGLAGYGHGIVSFNLKGCHPHDVATILDQAGVAVRSGHHCAMPLMKRLGVEGTVRASLGLYTVKDDIDQLVAGLGKARALLAK
jgi:cysteine desulfurase/selenocysteine lyase